jgi:hypothetical protein
MIEKSDVAGKRYKAYKIAEVEIWLWFILPGRYERPGFFFRSNKGDLWSNRYAGIVNIGYGMTKKSSR